MSMTFDERYRAIAARDPRFDGQFVTAVRSTGIYCRPSCPARTPNPQHVSFFATSAAAHEAGYRACKRCLPEATPGSPAWDVRGDVVARAMRLIADGVLEREGVAGLGAALGYSSRHLSRLLTAELGAGPLAIARAHRAQTARSLLIGTNLTMADVAFSASFASIRQFNDTVREIFGLTPTQLRARRATDGVAPSGISLALPVRPPFDAHGVFAWLAERAIPGVEEATATSFSRTIRMEGGAAWFEVRSDASSLRLSARLENLADLGSLVSRVRGLFDLDADPLAIDRALSEHAAVAPLVAQTPGIRVPGASDPFELLVRAMIGQQISVAAARTHLGRLVDRLGAATDVAGAAARLFPTPEAIVERGTDVLAGPARRIEAIVGAAHAIATGTLRLTVADDVSEQRARLLAMPGIGPWTADYVRMRVSRDPDVLLPGDLALRRGAAAIGLPAEPRELATWAGRAAPWRSYLSMHLWRAAQPPEGER
ncbi:AlkA N-terminal domain-containing protein [Microbacterium faecale]|uniref:AlkA N-terminal domain-containing protein n=1 Tax=Microbacterium faecale TaxID=1804630 RepID=UPI001663F7DE|nr:AlkA N-terminal domain-containing protein [Microbacterium faecale]